MVVVAAGAGGSHKLLLISGKQNGSSSGSQTAFSRPISVVLPSAASQASSDSDSNSSAGPPVRKRQRLTHLSPEEKALRRSVSPKMPGGGQKDSARQVTAIRDTPNRYRPVCGTMGAENVKGDLTPVQRSNIASPPCSKIHTATKRSLNPLMHDLHTLNRPVSLPGLT